MFFARFLILAFFVAYSFSMGQNSAHELNAFGKLISFSFFLAAPALYMLPTYEAWRNKHRNLTAISLVNIFLGWSLLGWIAALVWAFKKTESASIMAKPASPITSPPPAAPQKEQKKCPFCAEEILIEAIKCKHCGSNINTLT